MLDCTAAANSTPPQTTLASSWACCCTKNKIQQNIHHKRQKKRVYRPSSTHQKKQQQNMWQRPSCTTTKKKVKQPKSIPATILVVPKRQLARIYNYIHIIPALNRVRVIARHRVQQGDGLVRVNGDENVPRVRVDVVICETSVEKVQQCGLVQTV